MKKVIPGVIVLAAIAIAAAFFLLKKTVGHHTPAVQLVPAETIFFLHFPDLKRTADRWPQTGLAQIGAEPEVQAFLAKPRSQAPQLKLWTEKFQQVSRVDPGEAFVSVTSIEGNHPRFIAGLSFSGHKTDVEALIAEPRAEMKRTWPAGKSDIALHGDTEIETFTHAETTVGQAFVGDWYFVANDLDLLKQTIDAHVHGLGAKALSANDLFQKSTSHLPADGEAVLFAQVAVFTERIVSLLVASGQAPDPRQIEDLKKIQAVAWGTKFEGEKMRDTLFVLSPGNAMQLPLARSSLALSGPGTVLTYATTIPATIEVPESSLALGALVPGFSGMEKALSDKGLKFGDLGKAFGPEFGVVANWVENTGQPSTLLALDVRDSALARGFIDVFTGGAAGGAAWGRSEENGVAIFQSPAATGLLPITPTAALTEKFLVVGFSALEVTAALEQLKSGQAMIAATPSYGQSVKSVSVPTAGFGYLDLKTVFERAYGTLRPFIAMSLAFSPDAGKYIDAGKLPTTDVIGKHLGPSVYSQSVTPDGTLVESVGTLTFNQLFVGTVGSALAAAFPMIENAMAGGLKLDPNSMLLPTPPASPTPSGKSPTEGDLEAAPKAPDAKIEQP